MRLEVFFAGLSWNVLLPVTSAEYCAAYEQLGPGLPSSSMIIG